MDFSVSNKVGHTLSTIQLVATLLVAAVLIGISIWLFRKGETFRNVHATVLSGDCVQRSTRQKGAMRVTYDCNVDVEYEVDGVVRRKRVTGTSGRRLTPGDPLEVEYEIGNPDNVRFDRPKNRTIAWILLAVAVFAVLWAVLWFWLTKKKGFGTYHAVNTLIG